MTVYEDFRKRLLDITCASAALLVFAPVMAIVALLVRIKLGRPVIFRQVRAGKNARPFTLCKFRTMNDAKDPEGQLLADDKRLTAFGRCLREYSLDELPQFWNLLRGNMSLVGPRPLLMEYLPRYTPEQTRRHAVRPGITGWAQVNGRNAIGWKEKFALDVWYVEHAGLLLDLRILWMTCLRVLHRSGVSSEGHATMPEFMGITRQE